MEGNVGHTYYDVVVGKAIVIMDNNQSTIFDFLHKMILFQ